MLHAFSLTDPAGRARVAGACESLGLSFALWTAVLDARSRHGAAGNRRRLFAAFDELFDGAAAPALAEVSTKTPVMDAAPTSDRVTLSRLVLKNWKVFNHAEFAFPDYDADRPVVLIGGKNGYGKTSFLEGLFHGLFGRYAVTDLERALGSSSGLQTGKGQMYRQTLERALHRPARDRGDGVMSVRSEWRTGEGDLIVERRWYFDDQGALVEEDEGLNLWTGPDHEVLAVPPGESPEVFYQAEITRRLMPPSLAAFVLFDGEQVKRFAEHDFADQVRVAVETVLGLTAWREAIADLRDYARDRSRGAVRNEEADRANDESLASLELAETAVLDSLATVEAAAAPMRARRDEVLESLGALSSRTYATMQELLERRQTVVAELARLRHDLATAASSDLPLVLVGQRLRDRLHGRLSDDQARAGVGGPWAETGLLDRLVYRLNADLADPDTGAVLEGAVRKAWSALAQDARDDHPTRHPYLVATTRNAALARLSSAPSGVADAVAELAARLDGLASEKATLDLTITDREAQDQTAERLRNDLDAVTIELGEQDDQRRALDQALGRIKSDLSDLRQAVETRLEARLSDAQLIGRRRGALKTAERGEALINLLKPDCFEAVGAAVTEAYSALAHKGLVDRIVIAPDGGVMLLDGRGADLRAGEASAGESQVFAMALMASVARLAGRKLPSVIDTPLGRLDPDHRRRVLSFFTSRDVQTILLSQPDEVNSHYLELIADRVAAQFHLEHIQLADGPGGSTPQAGYFPELAA